MLLHVTVNGVEVRWSVAPGDVLLEVLRREGYFGVKHGCDSGDCGCCTVLIDGYPMNSCLMLAAQAEGRQITTIEGLAQSDELHVLQQAFIDAAAIQCGFCSPGMILARRPRCCAKIPRPSAAEVGRGAERRAVPLHGLRQAGPGGAAGSGSPAARGNVSTGAR